MWGAFTFRMSKIIFGTDGSADAERAAEYAVDLARERDATLHVICVVDRRVLDEPALSSDELTTILVEDHCSEAVERIRSLAADAGVSVETVSRHGTPHETIHQYAEEIGAESIVVGHHGERGEHCGGVRRRLAELAPDYEVVVAPPDTEGAPLRRS